MSQPLTLFLRWEHAASGAFSLAHGEIQTVRIHAGKGTVRGTAFCAEGEGSVTLALDLSVDSARYGATAPRLQWEGEGAFAVVVTQLPKEAPARLVDFGVTIARTATALDAPVPAVCETPERLPTGRAISWETSEERTQRIASVPTLLGLSRDQRFFIIDSEKGTAHSSIDLRHPVVHYELHHAATADKQSVRRLDDGALPILHTARRQGPFELEETLFVTLATTPLVEASVPGTPLRFAHLKSVGCTFAPGEQPDVEKAYESYEAEGEVVLYHRIILRNTSRIPRLAVQHFPMLERPCHREWLKTATIQLDAEGALRVDGRAMGLHRLNGEVPQSMQPAFLLEEGEEMILDSILPHRIEGLSPEAVAAGVEHQARLEEARAYWQAKLPAFPKLPDARLSDFWRAGLLHLELSTLGERGGPLTPKVGVYTAIGSESIPIIDFYNSLGLHEIAGRCLDGFFALQHPSGRINLFNHYDIETGAVLYEAGQHYGYTRDLKWVDRHREALRLAADYLLSLRQLSDPDSDAYGLLSGTCADPLEKTTSFMFNAYAGAGLLAVATLFEALGDEQAPHYREAAEAVVDRYRKAFSKSFDTGPILPVSESRWVPTMAPWVEGIGLQVHGLKGEASYTHRTYQAYDALLGPLYGVTAGLITPESREAKWLLEVNAAHFNRQGVIESQPYYGRHPEVHLLRGEREAFLNAFYNGIVSLADRETFSFWEHYYHVSIHKTHEEGWALMQARRMLWLENGSRLMLLPGIPESWLDDGTEIAFEGASTFGPFGFRLTRKGNSVRIEWRPRFHEAPTSLRLDLPGITLIETGAAQLHPEGWLELSCPGEPADYVLTLS